MKEKYLFCYLKTGGGHFAPSSAIANEITKLNGNKIEPILVDGLSQSNLIAKLFIEYGYRFLQNHAKKLFELLYAANKINIIGKYNLFLSNIFIKPYFLKLINEKRPSKIIILHFLLIKPVLQALKELNINIPVFVVVTDPFTIHPIWFNYKNIKYILFSDKAKKYALKCKIPENNIYQLSFPVDEKYSKSLSRRTINLLKKKLIIPIDKKIILIIGGGDGIPKGNIILSKVLSSMPNHHIIIVCGRNKSLLNYSDNLQNKYSNLTVYGFTDKVYELLNISDFIITKCGASTIYEILLQKKIPIVNQYIWEQELGNMEYIRDNKLGVYEKNIETIPKIIYNLSNDEQLNNFYHQNIANLKLQNGVKEVAKFIVNYK